MAARFKPCLVKLCSELPTSRIRRQKSQSILIVHNSSVSLLHYSDLVERTITLPLYWCETCVIGDTRIRGNKTLSRNLTSAPSVLRREERSSGFVARSPTAKQQVESRMKFSGEDKASRRPVQVLCIIFSRCKEVMRIMRMADIPSIPISEVIYRACLRMDRTGRCLDASHCSPGQIYMFHDRECWVRF